MKRLGPKAIILKKKKKKVNLKEKVNHGFTNHQAEVNTGGFSRTTVGCNT